MKRTPLKTNVCTRVALCRGCWKNFVREKARTVIWSDGEIEDDWATDGTMRICADCAAERWGKIVHDGLENWRRLQ